MVDALCPASVDYLDVDQMALEIDDPLLELYQDLVHSLFQAPGTNLDAPDRGVGISAMLSEGFDTKKDGGPGRVMKAAIESDFRKDVRVLDVRADVTKTSDNPLAYDVAIQVVANEGELGIHLVKDGDGVRVVSGPGKGP